MGMVYHFECALPSGGSPAIDKVSTRQFGRDRASDLELWRKDCDEFPIGRLSFAEKVEESGANS
jgi:hypothetical protein